MCLQGKGGSKEPIQLGLSHNVALTVAPFGSDGHFGIHRKNQNRWHHKHLCAPKSVKDGFATGQGRGSHSARAVNDPPTFIDQNGHTVMSHMAILKSLITNDTDTLTNIRAVADMALRNTTCFEISHCLFLAQDDKVSNITEIMMTTMMMMMKLLILACAEKPSSVYRTKNHKLKPMNTGPVNRAEVSPECLWWEI